MSDYHKRLSEVDDILEGWEHGILPLTKMEVDSSYREQAELIQLIKNNCKHTKCNNLSYVIYDTDEYGSDRQRKYNDIYCADCDTCLIYGRNPNNFIFTSDIDQDLLTCIKFHEDKCGVIESEVMRKLGVYFTEKTERTYYRTQK